jgi:hypothetical protein
LHRWLLYCTTLSLALVLGALATGIIGAGHATGSVRDASSAIAAPDATPTYFSELAPPVSRPPREAELPLTGISRDTSIPWVPAAGVAFALLGVLLTYAGLFSSRREHVAP